MRRRADTLEDAARSLQAAQLKIGEACFLLLDSASREETQKCARELLNLNGRNEFQAVRQRLNGLDHSYIAFKRAGERAQAFYTVASSSDPDLSDLGEPLESYTKSMRTAWKVFRGHGGAALR
jgi:hypothetical protein